jgi:hypothetical protein
VLYVSILCKPDRQYLLTVGSTDEKTEGISTVDFLPDPDIEEQTEMQRDYACMRIANRMFCEDMMDFDDDNPMEDSNI